MATHVKGTRAVITQEPVSSAVRGGILKRRIEYPWNCWECKNDESSQAVIIIKCLQMFLFSSSLRW